MDIYLKNVLNDEIIKVTKNSVEYNESLIHIADPYSANPLFYKYYASKEIIITGVLPYIIKNDFINWNVSLDKVNISDFILTHPCCLDEGLYVEIGFPMAGGPGIVDINRAINNTIDLIKLNHPVLGYTLETAVYLADIIKAFEGYYEDKDITPKEQLDALINNEFVSNYVIMEIMNYDEYHAREFLKLLGYYKDSKPGKYKINEINRFKAKAIIDSLDDSDY